MARRNDIGSLNVRLQASTQEFVRNMAQAERSVERVANTSRRAVPAISAVGGAIGRSSFGRGGAVGAAGIGLLEGLGLGALGAGAGGLAIAGVSIAVQEITHHFRAMADAAKERAAAEQAAAAALRDQLKVLDDFRSRQFNNVFGNTPEGRLRLLGLSQLSERQPLEALLGQRRVAVEDARARLTAFGQGQFVPGEQSYITRERLLGELRQAERVLEDVTRAYQELRDAQRGELSRLQDVIAGERLSEFLPLIPDPLPMLEEYGPFQELAEASIDQGDLLQQILDEMQQGFDEWSRQNQRASDQIVTSANRIYTQVLQLQSRRN